MKYFTYEDTPMGRCLRMTTRFCPTFMTNQGLMEFKELYTGLHLAGPFNNDEFDYFLFISITDFEEATGEKYTTDGVRGYQFVGEIKVVAPSEVPDKEWKSALSSCGWDEDPPENLDLDDPEVRAEILCQYGIAATVLTLPGDDEDELLEGLRAKARAVEGMFGFYMDQTLNALGATGWDWIRGNVTPW